MKFPEPFDDVEIFVDDEWIEVTYYRAGSFTDSIGKMKWCDYFLDHSNLKSYPSEPLDENHPSHIGYVYPEWRKLKGN